ncbi:hypothetical protein D3C72_1494820 [compost metagenome]
MRNDGVGPGDDAGGVVARAEGRQDVVADDHGGIGVGQHALQAIADLDAHLAFVRRDDQQRAAVVFLLSDAPVTTQLIAEVLDLLILKRGQGDDHQLIAGLLFQRGQLAGQGLFLFRAQKLGVIDHPPR